MRVPAGADRDFTASGFVVDEGRVLLIDHTKLGRWLQPGGHVEGRETPVEAAIREVREETGVVMTVHESLQPVDEPAGSESLPQPFRVNLHEVHPGHWHVDFAYLGTVERTTAPDDGEPDEARWFTPAEVETLPRIDEHTRSMAVRAIRRVG